MYASTVSCDILIFAICKLFFFSLSDYIKVYKNNLTARLILKVGGVITVTISQIRVSRTSALDMHFYKLGIKQCQCTNSQNYDLAYALTLELNDVIALFSRDSRSLRATGVAIVVSISTALAAAFSNDSDMVVG